LVPQERSPNGEVGIMFKTAIYHVLISDEHKHDDQQSLDQAYLGIGANLASGFPVYCYSFKGRDDTDVTVISVHSTAGHVFGAYEFTDFT
jgi:hypothetical protein